MTHFRIILAIPMLIATVVYLWDFFETENLISGIKSLILLLIYYGNDNLIKNK
jgi:hypothetical protein